MRESSLIVAFGLIVMIGCKPDQPTSPTAPRFDLGQAGSVSGNILGPDGTSICHFIPDGSGMNVRVLNVPPIPASFAGSEFVSCPDSSFAIALDPGSYFLRVTLPSDPGIGSLPIRYLVANPVAVSAGAVHQDVTILPGSGLGGGATFDGAPLPGIDIQFAYDQPSGYQAQSGTTGDDGGWVDPAGREPLVLQNGLRYQASPCEALGSKLLQGTPATAFLFPGQLSSIQCVFTTAPAVRFSHTRTKVAVTPMPGDLGGLSTELSDQYGIGWGVQYPAPPLNRSVSLSQLFLGGLIVGVRPDRILSGVDVGGYMDCGPACRDLGLNGKLSYTSSPQFGTKVIWHYSDATSAEGVGLKVLQKSYDGVPPNDYVLFHFIFTNSARSTLTFYPGVFMDWDIDGDPSDDVGATELNGRLMYMTDDGGSGNYAGTLLLGAPVSGNAFFTDFGQSTATQVAALDGDLSVPAISDPGDHRYMHALGPITLNPGASSDIWVAVVAGQTHDQLLGNAAAAAAQAARLGSDAGDETDAVTASYVDGVRTHAATRRDPRCKKSGTCRRLGSL